MPRTHLLPIAENWGRADGEAAILLYVADSHPLILDAVRGVFRAAETTAHVEGFVSFDALEEAMTRERQPDLVLVDYRMPGLGSVESLGRFVTRHPERRIAVISGHADSDLVRDVIRSGCRGFVPKSLTPHALYHAVRLMISGGRFLPEFLIEGMNTDVPADSQPAPTPRSRAHLTAREADVLRELSEGLTNKQIATRLKIEEVTVKLHLRRGFTKLGVRNRVEATRAVLEGALD